MSPLYLGAPFLPRSAFPTGRGNVPNVIANEFNLYFAEYIYSLLYKLNIVNCILSETTIL